MPLVADLLSVLTNALLGAAVVAFVMLVERKITRLRRHHTLANRRFLRRYRIEQSKNRGTTVSLLRVRLLVVRLPAPAGAALSPAAAPAGSSQRHAA